MRGELHVDFSARNFLCGIFLLIFSAEIFLWKFFVRISGESSRVWVGGCSQVRNFCAFSRI